MDEDRRGHHDTRRAPDPTAPIRWEHPESVAGAPRNGHTRPDPPAPREPRERAVEPAAVVELPPLELRATAPAVDESDTDVDDINARAIDLGDDEFDSQLVAPVESFLTDAAPVGNGHVRHHDIDAEDTNRKPHLADDEDAWRDEDDEWDLEPVPTRSAFFGTRAARLISVVAVVTIAALLASTVLLWQRVEDVKADVSTVPAKPVGNSELTDLRRRLARLETQVAATTDDTGNLVGPTDELRAELASLRQCVATFQQRLTQSRGQTPIVIC
jgi:hypothetical protein